MRSHRVRRARSVMPIIWTVIVLWTVMVLAGCGGSDDGSAAPTTTGRSTTTSVARETEAEIERRKFSCDAQGRFSRGIMAMRPDAAGTIMDSAANVLVGALKDLKTLEDEPKLLAAVDVVLPVAEALSDQLTPETTEDEVEALANEAWVNDPEFAQAGNTIVEYDFGCDG